MSIADIALRILRVEGDCFIMKIEVDGVHHLRQKTTRFCMLRDEYLKSRRAVVERLDVSRMNEVKDRGVKDGV